MNTIQKYSGYLFVVCMLISAMLYSYDMRKKYIAEKERAKAFENTISDLHQKIETFKVKMNDSIEFYAAKVNTLQMTKENIQARYDKLLYATDIKSRDVQSMADVGMEIKDTVYVPVNVDVFGGITTGYKDDFTTISVSISPDKEAAISYDIKDSISIINVQKRHSLLFGLIKWKETEKTTVISHNPKSMIVGVTSIEVVK